MNTKLLLTLALLVAIGLGMALNSKSVQRRGEPKPGSTWIEPTTGMQFVWVPSGCGLIGTNGINEYRGGSYDHDEEVPEHEVCVDGFYLGKFEVTQAEYEKISGNNPSRFKGSDHPVENVSWDDAQRMASVLNGHSAGTFRLPSEAEWEYACRAGGLHKAVKNVHDALCGDGELHELAWYDAYNNLSTQAVGGKRANAWGLYDMNGNVGEWTQDCWHTAYPGAPTDGSAWLEDGDCEHRVKRGGGWYNAWFVNDASNRGYYSTNDPNNMRSDNLGFRLVRLP